MDSIGDVLRCVGRAITIFAICCAIGLHWIALQSVAWTTMIVEHSKCARLGQAIEQTFDGAHPCSLCHVVNKGTASEKKSGAQSSLSKIDIVWVARPIRLLPPFAAFEYPIRNFPSSGRRPSPPVPPPRSFLS